MLWRRDPKPFTTVPWKKEPDEPGTRTDHVVGLDLGQAADFSALCVLARTQRENERRHYAVRALRRWPLQTPYTQIAADVVKAFEQEPLTGSTLIVDEGHAGRAVVDMLRNMHPKCGRLVPTAITCGLAETQQADGSWHVAKVRLVGNLLVLMQSGRFVYATQTREIKAMIKELENFRYKYTEAGNQTFAAREGKHDDLIMGTALAAWWASRFGYRKLHMEWA
jgi:hypothetical protein